MDDIAVEANVTKPTVYYHFPSKEALYSHICTQHSRRTSQYLETLRSCAWPPAEALIDLVWNLVAGCVHTETFRLLFDNHARVSAAAAVQVIRQSQHEYVDEFARVIEAAQATGDAYPGDPRLMALAIFEAVGRISRWYDPSGRIAPEEAGPMMVRMFLRTLLPEDRAALFETKLAEAADFFPERFILIKLGKSI
jgi:AcrR family transcriptional regulator